jgi:hypothetical protein
MLILERPDRTIREQVQKGPVD